MTRTASVVIVDDEEPARRKVRRFLGDDRRFAVVGEAESGPEAVERIVGLEPHLVFLDVQMPGFNGFEVLASLPDRSLPRIIFTTAFAEFALQAFDVRAVDYLLKPFDQDRFRAACDAYWERPRDAGTTRRALASMGGAGPHLDRLLVKVSRGLIPIALRDVTRISAEEKYVRLYVGAESYLHRMGLGDLMQRLDPARFVRVHRSEVVNVEAIASIEPWGHGDATVHLKDGTHLLASRTYRKEWLGRFG